MSGLSSDFVGHMHSLHRRAKAGCPRNMDLFKQSYKYANINVTHGCPDFYQSDYRYLNTCALLTMASKLSLMRMGTQNSRGNAVPFAL